MTSSTANDRRGLLRRMRLGAFAATAALVVAPLWIVPAAAAPSAPPDTGIDVLVFNDPTYVDVGSLADIAAGDYSHEGINIRLALTGAGNTVTTLDSNNAAAIQLALVGKDVFVIPETEMRDLGPDLTVGTIQTVRQWVGAGGTLIVSRRLRETLNPLMGYALTDGVDAPDNAWELFGLAGATFVGGPAALARNNGSTTVTLGSLPTAAVPVYSDPVGGAIVFSAAYGQGTVVGLGWDWFSARPANPSGQDGGWNAVLQRAVNLGKPAVAPGKVRKLKVKGKRTAAMRRVTWATPASDGGAALTGYRVRVTQKGRTVFNKAVAATKHKVRISSRKLSRANTAKVRVRAINEVGPGKWRTVKFRTVQRR